MYISTTREWTDDIQPDETNPANERSELSKSQVETERSVMGRDMVGLTRVCHDSVDETK